MRTAIVKSSELGTECWSAKRFVGECFKCDKYETCKYEVRVENPTYDKIRRLRVEKKQELDDVDKKIREMKGERE